MTYVSFRPSAWEAYVPYPRTGFVAWCYESMLVFNRNK
nr:MAG TPA: papain-like protease [Caudoviricetes sp.]